MAGHAAQAGSAPRATRDAARTRKSILDAAIAEFAQEGFAGARIDRIGRSAGTNDRMLYYYFGSKEGLCLAVIEAIYESQVTAERAMTLDLDDPVSALRDVVGFHWRYYDEHPELISILNSENLCKAEHLAKSADLSAFSSPMLDFVHRILTAGIRKGVFSGDVTAEHLFLTICAMTYFYLSNQHTLSNYLNRDLNRAAAKTDWLEHAKHVVVCSVTTPKRQ